LEVIEEFTQSKSGDEALNEDRIVVTDDFIAVIDGATSRAGAGLQGMSGGRFAALVLLEGIKEMPPRLSARAAIDRLTLRLEDHTRTAAAAEKKELKDPWSFPAAALLVYSRYMGEIWRVADSTYVVDGAAHAHTFPQEEIWCKLRHACLCAKLAKGATEEELSEKDPTWDILTPLISELKVFANYDGPYGYGVMNGAKVPDRHIEIFDAGDAREIIFASDGYPDVLPTLAETETQLKSLIAQDPLMYKLSPQVKGVKKGGVSFDDRSYIRFRP
jgi:hypothetical protein